MYNSGMNKEFYDGTELLSQVDINKKTPELYLCVTNNSAGKTSWWNRYLVKKFVDKKEKFLLITRFKDDLADVADEFYNNIKYIDDERFHFLQEYNFDAKKRSSGKYAELYLNENVCGYAVSLNLIDFIKRKSHFFYEVKRGLMDEFISESGHYCSDELRKFLALHKAIGREQGNQARYFPIILLGNPYTMLNPYFDELGVIDRLKENTKFLRGNGWVLERSINTAASKALSENLFNQAFINNDYMKSYSIGGNFTDNDAFIEKPKGRSIYICTIKYDGVNYGIRKYENEGVIYCDDSADLTCPIRISMTSNDHSKNYIMSENWRGVLFSLKDYYNHGCMRFKNLKCKIAILKSISVTIIT